MKKLKEYFRTKGLKDLVIFVLSAALVGGTFAITKMLENSNQYVGKRATKFVIEKLNSDDELLAQSQAMDYYETIYNNEYRVSDGLAHIERDIIEGNNIVEPKISDSVTLEEVRNSIKNITTSMPRILNKGRKIRYTEEEIATFQNMMAHDYAVIMKYATIHQDEDYSNFLIGTISKMLDNLYQENTIDNIQINCIVPVSDDMMAIEANVNGKVMNFTIQGKAYYDLISKVLEKNKSTFVFDLENLNNALNGKTYINENNKIVSKTGLSLEEKIAIGALLIMMLGAAVVSQSGMIK